jgi:hypothetical protein
VRTNRPLSLAILLLLVACEPRPRPALPVAGQATAARDTGVSHAFQVYLRSVLAPQLALASSDTTTRPWRLELPAADSGWQRFTDRLMRDLRARPATGSDSAFSAVTVGPIEIRGDTAFAAVAVSDVWRCRPDMRERARGSFGTAYSVRRRDGSWSLAVSPRGIAGNSVPCPRSRPGSRSDTTARAPSPAMLQPSARVGPTTGVRGR